MYLGGLCLSKGYLNLPEQTNKNFIKSPFNKDELLYRTGDITKLHLSGVIEYIGRQDFQVKINGYRIETCEIQSKIQAYKQIKDCFVTVINFDNSKALCAYYVSDSEVNLNDLKNFLLSSLPKYMIPKFFISVKSIPLTVNGKIDKSTLPIPEKKINTVYVAPTNKLESTICDIFTKTLQIDKISVMQNIFDFSVDSLTIIKIQTKLYSLGISIDTQVFYNYPTIRDIANYITNKSESSDDFTEFEGLKIPEIVIQNLDISFDYKNILLFGVTGFLGIHILHELLENTEAHIYCIIREKDKVNAIERFKQKYSFYYNNIDEIISRITPITGDLHCNKFNLLDQTYEELSNNIDCVFSSAAIVKHFGNPDVFYKTNVLGTQKIVDFCLQNNLPFHYVSTLSICGNGLTKNSNTNISFTENDFYINQNYNDNIYVKSKFQAEAIILNACKYSHLKASIYRIGNITNRYNDGIFQENASENAFLNRLSSIINLGCIPKEIMNLNLEFTPVDYCAKFIVELSKKMYNNLNIYHLYNNNCITYSKFNNILKNYGYILKTLDFETFKNTILTSNLNNFGITNYLSSATSESINIDNSFTNNILHSYGLHWPPLTDEYISEVINYLKNYNFIGEPYETKE